MGQTPARALVSVVVPTHDRPQLLEAAVASVRAQTYDCWELLIVDDASTPAVSAEPPPAMAGRMRVLRNDVGLGGAACKARGAAAARGDIVAFLDDDDLYAPTLLAQAVRAFERHPELEVVFVGVEWFGRDAAPSALAHAESLQRVIRLAEPSHPEANVMVFDRRLLDALLYTIPMDFQRPIVRRAALERIGPHRADCLLWDCDWALRAALAARCGLLRQPLYRQRADGQAYHSRPDREPARIASAVEMTLRLAQQTDVAEPRVRELLLEAAGRNAGSLAYYHALHGPLSASLSAWWTSRRLSPRATTLRLPVSAVAHAALRVVQQAANLPPRP